MSRSTLTDNQRRALLAAGAAAIVLAAVVALLILDGDDDASTATVASTTSTTTATTASTASTSSTTSSTTFAPAVDPYAVAFPSPTTSRSFESAEPAARAYATDVLGFVEPELDPASQTADTEAEVVLRGRPDGPETTIELRQFDTGAWYVVGSTTPDVAVTQPTAGASLASPFETTGQALAFEGTVEVVVLAQDDPTPLGEGIVTGSGSPPAGPFTGSISFAPPADATPGVVVHRVRSPEDGRVVQATSMPVRLTALPS